MRNAEAAMMAYAQLAWLSHQKRQALARDRFLVLAGVRACEAGWPTVAAECHRLVSQFAPQHQLARFATFPDALKDESFRGLVKSIERHCPFEKAELLLEGLGETRVAADSDRPVGDQLLDLLNRPEWLNPSR